MSDAEKKNEGLTRREFAKTVAAGVAAVAAAQSLNALEAHAAPGASKMTEAAAGQVSSTEPKEKTAIEAISENVRSLSGLSRLDGGVLWPDLLPGQFR
jgi:hypothetical protein